MKDYAKGFMEFAEDFDKLKAGKGRTSYARRLLNGRKSGISPYFQKTTNFPLNSTSGMMSLKAR